MEEVMMRETAKLSDKVVNPIERTALIVATLWERERLTTREVVELTGVSRQGAYDLMRAISRVLPVVQVNAPANRNYYWRLVKPETTQP